MNERAETAFESDATHLIHRRYAVLGFALVSLAIAIACVMSIAGATIVASAVALCACAALVATLTYRHRAVMDRPGRLVLSGEAVRLERSTSEVTIRRDEIQRGWFAPSSSRVMFDLRGGRRLSVLLPLEKASDLLRALRLDVTQRTLRVPLRGTIGTPVRTLVMAMFGLFPAGFAAGALSFEPLYAVLAFVAIEAAVIAGTIRWLGSPRAVIGADGVRYEHLLVRKFYPYASIASAGVVPPFEVQAAWRSVVLRLENGNRVELPMIGEGHDEVSGLIERIQAARARTYDTDVDTALDRLARGGRSIDDWRKDLAHELQRVDGYRHVFLGREQLLGVLQNARATADRRLTAAMALSVVDASQAPELIRVAAEAAASEPIRVALDAIADGDVDASLIDRAVKHDDRARR